MQKLLFILTILTLSISAIYAQESYRGLIGANGNSASQVDVVFSNNEAIVSIGSVPKIESDKSQLITFLSDEPRIIGEKYWIISFDANDIPTQANAGGAVESFECNCNTQSGGGGCTKEVRTVNGTKYTSCKSDNCIGCCSGYLKDAMGVSIYPNPGSFIILRAVKITVNGIVYQ